MSQLLGENPGGYFTFKHNQETWKGFPIGISGEIYKSMQRVILMAHPDIPEDVQQKMFIKSPNKIYA